MILIVSTKTLKFLYNYFFLKEHLKGWFVGGTFNHFQDFKVTEKVSNLSASKDFESIGLRFGYYLVPFQKINLLIILTLGG